LRRRKTGQRKNGVGTFSEIADIASGIVLRINRDPRKRSCKSTNTDKKITAAEYRRFPAFSSGLRGLAPAAYAKHATEKAATIKPEP